MDGVGGGIFDEQRQESKNAANKQREKDEVHNSEYEKTASHGAGEVVRVGGGRLKKKERKKKRRM